MFEAYWKMLCKLLIFTFFQGIPYVIYWETELPNDGASQFRQALLSVIQRYFPSLE